MGEEMAERNINKGKKRKETEVEFDKDGKDLEKVKKKDKVDGLKDSVDSSEGIKEKKNKKKKHKEGKKEGADKLKETVVGRRNSEDCGDVSVGNGEEEQPKKHKKKKREREDGDDMMENTADDEHKHSEVRNRAGREGKDGEKLVVKEKNGDTVQDVVVGLEDEDRGDKSKKKKKKERKRGNVSDDVEEKTKADEDGNRGKRKKKRKSENESDLVEEEVKTHEEMDKNKKKKKKMDSEDVSDGIEDEMEADEKGEKSKKKEKKIENASADVEDKTGTDEEGYKGDKKKKKEKKKKDKDESVSTGVEVELGSDEEEDKRMKKKRKRKSGNVSGDGGDTVHSKDVDKHTEDMKKKKKANPKDQVLNKKDVKDKARIETDTCDNPTPKRKSRKVSFSDEVEVFDGGQSEPKTGKGSSSDEEEASDDGVSEPKSWKESYLQKGLIQGKRYSKEEDKLIEEAVLRYIEEHNLGDDGIHMVLNCAKFPEVRKCWREIAEAIPWRPEESVYYRGHMLFERSATRKWTDEEKEYVLKFYEEHGADWRKLSTALDKHRLHCKDTWRRIRLQTLNKGRWSQEEYQNLFDLVNKDLRMRALEERKFKHGMLRDNICWEAISSTLATRHVAGCCDKWYKQLTSPMVNQGLWADTDDYRLLDALNNLDAASPEDVDWDCLVEPREGHICRKRWDQMVKHIGNYASMSFSEQVEVLVKRYNPDDLEAREAFDCQPVYP